MTLPKGASLRRARAPVGCFLRRHGLRMAGDSLMFLGAVNVAAGLITASVRGRGAWFEVAPAPAAERGV